MHCGGYYCQGRYRYRGSLKKQPPNRLPHWVRESVFLLIFLLGAVVYTALREKFNLYHG